MTAGWLIDSTTAWLFNDSDTVYFNDTKLEDEYVIYGDYQTEIHGSANFTTRQYITSWGGFCNKSDCYTVTDFLGEGIYLNLTGTNANQNIDISPYNLTVGEINMGGDLDMNNNYIHDISEIIMRPGSWIRGFAASAVVFGDHIEARHDKSYDIGNVTDRFRNLYLFGNISTQGNVSANYFFGDGAFLTNLNVSGNFTGLINSSNILNEYWVNESGDTMTGNLDVDANFTVNNSVFFVNANSGNVGIGTTSPAEKLDVNGTIISGIENGLQFRTQGTPFSMHTASAVFNGVRNDVLLWGYNSLPGTVNTKINASEPYFKFVIEANYFDGVNNYVEYNLDYLSADGLVRRRPMSLIMDRETHTGQLLFSSKYLSIRNSSGTQYAKFAPTSGLTIRGFALDGRTNASIDDHRPTFQPTVNNKVIVFEVMPKGSPTGANAVISLWNTDYRADTTNWERLSFYATDNKYNIKAEGAGTGVVRDINFQNGDIYINTTSHNIGIGTSNPMDKLHVADGAVRVGTSASASSYANREGVLIFNRGDLLDSYLSQISYSLSGTPAKTTLNFELATGASSSTNVMTLTGEGRVGIGTTSPTHELNVIGNANFTGYVIASNVWIPKYIFAYTNNTIPVASTGVWYNITFDEEEYAVVNGITHTYNDATNYSFYITEDGTYEVFGTVSIVDTSPNAEDNIFVYRMVKNGIEIHGSIWEGDFSRADSASKRNFNTLIECSVGDWIGLQFTGDDTDISLFARDSTGYGDHHPHSASIKIKRIA